MLRSGCLPGDPEIGRSEVGRGPSGAACPAPLLEGRSPKVFQGGRHSPSASVSWLLHPDTSTATPFYKKPKAESKCQGFEDPENGSFNKSHIWNWPSTKTRLGVAVNVIMCVNGYGWCLSTDDSMGTSGEGTKTQTTYVTNRSKSVQVFRLQVHKYLSLTEFTVHVNPVPFGRRPAGLLEKQLYKIHPFQCIKSIVFRIVKALTSSSLMTF